MMEIDIYVLIWLCMYICMYVMNYSYIYMYVLSIPSDETDVCYLIVSGIPKKPPESPNPQSEKHR